MFLNNKYLIIWNKCFHKRFFTVGKICTENSKKKNIYKYTKIHLSALDLDYMIPEATSIPNPKYIF